MHIVLRRLPKQIEANSQSLLELPALWKTLANGFERVAVVIAERWQEEAVARAADRGAAVTIPTSS